MPGLFKPLDKTINYVKMYSTFRNNTSDNCVAFILLPASPQKRKLSLGSLQFDFNAAGIIPAFRIFYDGDDSQIQKQAQKTMDAVDELNATFGYRSKNACIFNAYDKNLTVDLLLVKDKAYFGAVFDLLTRMYFIKDELAAEIKKQLLAQDYLTKEYKRLVPVPIKEDKSACILM